MSYPASFRSHVLRVQKAECLTNEAAALRFGIGVASLVHWKKRPAPQATRRRPWLKIDLFALARDLRDWPDAYHHERAARLGVSARGIGDALKRMGMTHEKSLRHPRADEDAWQRFREKIAAHEDAGKPIVYIDESGFAQDSPEPQAMRLAANAASTSTIGGQEGAPM